MCKMEVYNNVDELDNWGKKYLQIWVVCQMGLIGEWWLEEDTFDATAHGARCQQKLRGT